MNDVILYRVDATKHMWRYYRLDLQPDLFGLWLLIKEWGRIGRPGQACTESFATIDEAREALDMRQRGKQKRGYRQTVSQ
jgi:predicted DNA-binding WGR domain protein